MVKMSEVTSDSEQGLETSILKQTVKLMVQYSAGILSNSSATVKYEHVTCTYFGAQNVKGYFFAVGTNWT
jgi:hypothetical protein